MNVTEEDKHNLQLDPSSIPSPRFQFQHQFELPPGHTILRAQLLEGERTALSCCGPGWSIFVYLETLDAIFGVIQRKGRKLLLKREKIGQDVHLAFDESRRMLGVVSSDKVCGFRSIHSVQARMIDETMYHSVYCMYLYTMTCEDFKPKEARLN
ncbi:hypothetical protein BKA82DRAFT_2418030 [Pisolithus tinctorius]|nr:hypothetical protein BKA82DRAFT_2418030 [Pisolithus tinctorius]